MKNKTYKFYQDPGHGWIAVKRQELIDLGILDKITRFSYQNGKTVYLEEDCDAMTFILAYAAKFGNKPNLDYRHTDNDSPIRSYESFSPNESTVNKHDFSHIFAK